MNEMCALCPDLALCDIRLPDMSGEEAFRAAHVPRWRRLSSS
jgi:CheY-like chemotaxis protein